LTRLIGRHTPAQVRVPQVTAPTLADAAAMPVLDAGRGHTRFGGDWPAYRALLRTFRFEEEALARLRPHPRA
jgi:hypothetical protein